MKAVPIRDLKNKLSAYLKEVASGEIVLVTDRGQVVAELRKPSLLTTLSRSEQALQRLADQGALVLGLPTDPEVYGFAGKPLRAVDVQQALDAEREDGRS